VDLIKPIRSLIDMDTGIMENCDNIIERRLSDMRGMYADGEALEKLILRENPVVYRVYEVKIPEEEGQLAYSTTVLYPGKVGKEYFMTKGHFHLREETAEIYFCFSGQGYLLTQNNQGEVHTIQMSSGVLGYIPPGQGHRTLNTGPEEFVFLAVYPSHAGHNYGIIEEKGFARIMVEEKGHPELKDNPGYKRN